MYVEIRFPNVEFKNWFESPNLNFQCLMFKSPVSSLFSLLNEKANCKTRRLISSNNLGVLVINVFAKVQSLQKALAVFQG